jgi:translation elongation factor P/translation initiation factor 5A
LVVVLSRFDTFTFTVPIAYTYTYTYTYTDTDTYIYTDTDTYTYTDTSGKHIRHCPLLLESSSWPSAKCDAYLDW